MSSKNVLIVIHGMGCGGAEKSLITMLSYLQSEDMDIDLIVANPHGPLMKKIPPTVHVLEHMYDLENFAAPLNERTKKISSFRDFILQIKWQLSASWARKKENLSEGELRWKLWGRYLKPLKKHYDLAISYMNGFPNYYVIDKTTADKKILWIHNEFEKMGYDYAFEASYYRTADKIVTISQACVESFARVYPELRDKVMVLENISSADDILKKANEIPLEDPFFSFEKARIVSVGRLSAQKNFSLSIEAAKKIKGQGIEFLWYILGDGELRKNLTEQIQMNDLTKQVKLIGIKENPYPYIANCDVFVQSSIYEGKSIVLDEAKILCKPIVLTNYVTAPNSIESGKNGLIVDMTTDSLADGIIQLLQNGELREGIVKQLMSEQNSNDAEIEKYIALFTELMESRDENVDRDQ